MTPTNMVVSNITFDLPLVKQTVTMIVILSLAYGLVLFLAILGNVILLLMVFRNKQFHKPTYIFLVNLSVADLAMALFCLPVTLLSNIYNGWRFGAFLCRAAPYLQGVSVCASVNTLAAIALDRYLAICHVLVIRMSMTSARIIVVFVWMAALLIMTPWAIYYQQQTLIVGQQLVPLCVQNWPSEKQPRQFFLGAIFLFCYALPLAFIMCCYCMICYRVWNRDAPGIIECGVIQKSRVRVIKMLAIVVLLFALSWLPLYIVNLVLYFFRPLNSQKMRLIHNKIIPMAQWLGTSNSCVNPLVYCLFSTRIRDRVRLMFTCSDGRCCLRRKQTCWNDRQMSSKCNTDHANLVAGHTFLEMTSQRRPNDCQTD